MNQIIVPGVQLNTIETKQFKTIQITIQFVAPLSQTGLTKRALLAKLVTGSNQVYVNQAKLATKLQDLYGASLEVSAYRQGQLMIFAVDLKFVAPKFLPQTADLISEVQSFLQTLINKPDMTNQAVFDREYQNLTNEYRSQIDDKQTYAALSLNADYFDDPKQKVPSSGQLSDLKAISLASIWQDYQEIIMNDQVVITVVGPFETNKMKQKLQAMNLSARQTALPNLFYQQPLRKAPNKHVEVQDVQQAKLNLAYQTGIYYYQKDYFTLMVTNALFGGSPLSLLFTNVREKASLAYFASSQVDALRGRLIVRTGIDADNEAQVLQLIEQQRQLLISGKITEAQLQQAKLSLINQFITRLDSQNFLGQQAFNQWLVPETVMDSATFKQQINQVTIKQVQLVAEQLELQNIFLLKGATK